VRKVVDSACVPVLLPVKFESATRDSGPISRSLSYFSLNKCGKVLILHQNLPFVPSSHVCLSRIDLLIWSFSRRSASDRLIRTSAA
jgi:hypothetical protein